MARDVEALVLVMSADIRRMEKALNQARGQTNRQLGGIEQRFETMNGRIRKSGDELARDLRSSVAAIGVGLALRELGQAADRWTNLRNQVKQYADVVGPVGQATERLAVVANDAGVAVDALGTTFAASARAAKTLGASADQVFQFNEGVAKGAAIANTGVAALDGALTQLGQAIGSPKVQLVEFNSVIEGTPRLAQAFADGVTRAGGSVAKLRALIAAGDISGADLFSGLLSQLPKLRVEFAQTEATIGRSMTRLQNAFIQYVGAADRANSVSANVAGFIDTVANNFELLADAALVAAAVLGGALALGAMGRLIVGLRGMMAAAQGATTSLAALRAASVFFTGPVGAAVLAIGAALTVLALKTAEAQRPMERLEQRLNQLASTKDRIAADTEKLTAANNNLANAISRQGEASVDVARLEIDAIRRRIQANKQLAATYESQIRTDLLAVENQTGKGSARDARLTLSQMALRAFPNENVNRGMARLRQEAVDAQDAGGRLNATQRAVLELGAVIDKEVAEVANLKARLTEILKVGDIGIVDAGADAVAASATAATAALTGYRTAAEQLAAALLALRNARDAENAGIGKAIMARDEFAEQGPIETAEAAARLEVLTKAFTDLADAADGNALVRSREGVEALLNFAGSSGNLAAAIEALRNLGDVLNPADIALARVELEKLARDGLEAIATGFDALEIEHAARLAEIERALAAARAAGINGEQTALNARFRAHEEFAAAVADLYAELYPTTGPDGSISFNDAFGGGLTDQEVDDGVNRSGRAIGLIDTPEIAELRERMRQAVKDGLSEAIRTDDWGQAVKNVFAEAVTAGLDKALDRAGDFLLDLVFGGNGQSGWINAIGATFGMGGGRSAGGPTSPFTAHKVNEMGKGEFLFMGKNPGQVLNASQINALSAGKRGAAGISIDNSLHVAGSIDAATWPEIRAEMARRDQQLLSALPSAIDGRVADSRVRRRFR